MKYLKNNIRKLIILFFFLLVIIFGIIYYYFQKDNEVLPNVSYSLKLIGSEEVTIKVGETYEELGCFAYDQNGNNLIDNLKISGNVDNSKVGTYIITYKLKDIILYRKINVIEVEENIGQEDDLEIKLLGDSIIYLPKNKTYNVQGTIASDLYDGSLTSKILVKGSLDSSKLATYELIYTVKNSHGIEKSIVRKIVVYEILYNVNKKCSYSSCDIKFSFSDEYYKSLVLPNGIAKLDKMVNYQITKNGEYKFAIYDIYGNYIMEIIEVNEIDTISPSASCTLNLYDTSSKITVKASDNSGIQGYIYNYGNKNTSLITTSTYTYTDEFDTANVTVYDKANNYKNISCNVIDNSTTYSRSYKKYSGGYDYWLYVPSALTKRNKLPLVVYLHGRGECGDNVNNNSLPNYFKNGSDYNFLMVAPQLPSDVCGSGFYAKRVMEIIETILEKYPVDSNRVIITGFSLGGNGTYRMVKTYPEYFAAAIPLAASPTYEDTLTKTPIWAFHGEADDQVSYQYHKRVMEQVISVNPKSKFTLLENKGHLIYDSVYKNQDVINWIMNQYRT